MPLRKELYRNETRPQLFIGTDQIKEVESFKYFGLYIDTRLKLNSQIEHLKSKFLNFQAARNLYNSCI